MNKRRQAGDTGAGQSGVMLLEALIAILVFSLGILTVIAIQATSVKMAADAQLRSKASLLANRLVGEMWASGGKIAPMTTKFQTGGPSYIEWRDMVADYENGGLPGVYSDGDTAPTVDVTPGGIVGGEARNARVTITLFWRTPSMSEDEAPHQHIVTSFVSRNPS